MTRNINEQTNHIKKIINFYKDKLEPYLSDPNSIERKAKYEIFAQLSCFFRNNLPQENKIELTNQALIESNFQCQYFLPCIIIHAENFLDINQNCLTQNEKHSLDEVIELTKNITSKEQMRKICDITKRTDLYFKHFPPPEIRGTCWADNITETRQRSISLG